MSHAITDVIGKRLAYSHILVHIEPCKRDCDGCDICELEQER